MTDSTADATARRLLRSTAKQSYDPEVDLDWDAPLVDGAWFMQPERLSLYGTPLWDAMSAGAARRAVPARDRLDRQRRAVVRADPDADDGPRALRRRTRARERTQYALTEVGDECRHSVMFGRAIARCGVPAYGPTPHIHRLGRGFKTVAGGVSAYASILVAEEILDRWQRELMKDERVQPLIRMVSRDPRARGGAAHDLRPRGGRARGAARCRSAQLAWHRTITAQTAFMVARTLVNPQVYAAVGLDPREAKRAAFTNPHYRETLAWMGERVVAFLEEQGLIGPAQRPVWKRSLLMPS